MAVSVKFVFFIALIGASLSAFSSQVSAQDQSSGSQPQPTPAPQPENQAPPAQTSPQSQPENPPATAPPASQPSPEKRKPLSSKAGQSKTSRTGKKAASRKSQSAKKPATQSGKVVVRNGGATEGPAQLSPGMTQEQQLHDRENTNQLLSTTDGNLRSIAGRQLSPAQESMLDQIHTYVRQAREATDSGDLTRAHTLAYKAHLLSDELAKR